MRYIKRMVSLALLAVLAGCHAEEQTIGLTARGNSFDISNTEGETISCRSGDLSGDMDLAGQQVIQDASALADRYLLEVAFSDCFTYQSDSGGGQLFGIVSDPELNVSAPGYFEYTISGDGIETITISPNGELTFSGNDAWAEIACSMPCDSLGEHGFIRLSAGTTETAEVRVDAENGKIHFSGLSVGDIALSYAGAESDPWLAIELSAGSGSIDLSRLDAGQMIVAEDGCEDRVIEVQPQ